MKKQLLLFVACVMTMVSVASQAAIVIDQNQPDNSVYMAAFGGGGGLAQSFVQTGNNVAGAGIFLQAGIGSSDELTISLWDALPSVSNATMLASGTGTGVSGNWFDVFWNAVDIQLGSTYFLVFEGQDNSLGIAGSITNPYAFGNTFAHNNFASFAYAGFDYTFRTYRDGQVDAQVPEPTSIALLSLGLLGFAASRRKSAKSKNA